MNKSTVKEREKGMLSFVVVGASGDLAKRKVIPALFALHSKGYLVVKADQDFAVVGYARTKMNDDEFRKNIGKWMDCQDVSGKACDFRKQQFVENMHYVQGNYDADADFKHLNDKLIELEEGHENVQRIFFLSIPPSVFLSVASGIAGHCRPERVLVTFAEELGLYITHVQIHNHTNSGIARLVIEKPFGKDLVSCVELNRGLLKAWKEANIYRIDHYLGKELVQNLLVLRFGNLIFEPLWHRDMIDSVQITFSESIGIEGRGAYFDQYGIIRDVLQNHLIQLLALFAMEAPPVLDAEAVRDEKVRRFQPIRELVQPTKQQYQASHVSGASENVSYRDEPSVQNKESRTPTFAAVVLYIKNRRWDGVPFLLKAGKGMSERRAEIRVVFRRTPGLLFDLKGTQENNMLVIQIQPKESITFHVVHKMPGLTVKLGEGNLDMMIRKKSTDVIPDAYERLLLDVSYGEKSLFIRSDELEQAWKLFTPLLHDLETHDVEPDPYVFGDRGPHSADYLAARHGTKWVDVWE